MVLEKWSTRGGSLGWVKSQKNRKKAWGWGTTNQKVVLGVGKTPEKSERRRGVGETTNQKGSLGRVKPQKNRTEGGGFGKRPTRGGSLSWVKTQRNRKEINKVQYRNLQRCNIYLCLFFLCVLCNYPTIVRVFWYKSNFWSLDFLKYLKEIMAHVALAHWEMYSFENKT